MSKKSIKEIILKSVVGDKLTIEQVIEIANISVVDLILEYNLTDFEASKVMNHMKSEMYRHRAQAASYLDTDAKNRKKISYLNPPTRTYPVYEYKLDNKNKPLISKNLNKIRKPNEKELFKLVNECISDVTAGAMPLIGIGSLGAKPMSSRPTMPDKYTTISPVSNNHSIPSRNLDYAIPNEGGMAKSNLYNISVDAQELNSLLQDTDNLPQWTQEKIAVAKSMLNSVREYLESKIMLKEEFDKKSNKRKIFLKVELQRLGEFENFFSPLSKNPVYKPNSSNKRYQVHGRYIDAIGFRDSNNNGYFAIRAIFENGTEKPWRFGNWYSLVPEEQMDELIGSDSWEIIR